MRNAFLALERRTTAVALAFACLMLVAAACLGLYQILSRFVFHQPAEWSEVLIRFTLIWKVFLGAPVAFRQGAMVCVDLAHRMAGATGKRVLDLIAALCALVLLAVMLWFGAYYSWLGRFQTISGLRKSGMSLGSSSERKRGPAVSEMRRLDHSRRPVRAVKNVSASG